MSGLLPLATGLRTSRVVRLVPILLQKYFWGGGLKFSEPLIRPALRDVRDRIVSRQNDHRPSYRRYGASQRRKCLKMGFREIFCIVGFSTFATKSAITGSAPLFDHLVSQREHGRGDSDTERLRGFQIDDQSELVRLLYREIAGLRAAKNFGDLTTSATSLILPIC